jgi:Family of unknown function (DUF5681)
MVNPKSLTNLRPFKKGQSGNPGGLPKGIPKISPALVRFLAMPCRIFDNYKPRSVAEEIAKRMIELAIKGRPSVALRASVEVADRTCAKPGYATYLHYPNGEVVITYDDWQPPELVLERGDVFDEQNGILYPAGSLDEDSAEVA